MKKLLIILLFIFTTCINVYSQQYWLNKGRIANQNLTKCSFTDTLNGWAVGDSGLIIHTSNGGDNWIVQQCPIREYMVSVFFLNTRLGWAIAWGLNPNFYGTFILKTTNGGNTWDTTSYPVPDTYVRTIYFQDSLTGFMGGGPGLLRMTTNAGLNWIKANMDTTIIATRFPVLNFRFYSHNYGFGLGGVMDIAGVIWTTTNRGNYWTASIVAPEPLIDVKFYDSLNIIAIGGDYEYGVSLLRTSDGGQNWIYKNLEYFGVPKSLSFRTNNEGWIAMGDLPKFFVTFDSGLSWNESITPDTARIHDISFINNKFGVGVGSNGIFVKFNKDMINVGNSNTVINKFDLNQNYPNPFNPYTNIGYSVSEISEVELKIFNLLGQEIVTLYKGIRPAGNYMTKFNGNNFPSGIYFYSLNIRNIKSGITDIITKKMVLLK